MMEADIPPIGTHTRDKLDSYIDDYNAMFGTSSAPKTARAFTITIMIFPSA